MKKRTKKLALLLGCAAIGVVCVGGCGKKKAEAVDLNSLTLDQITEEAKKEGRVDSVGMPDNWANWV